MELFEIIVIGIGLAMDVFAISIGKGLVMKKMNWKNTIIIALCFGLFHMIFPILGYFLGEAFSSFVQNVDHWIAFILLAIIGGNMIKDSNNKEEKNDSIEIKKVLILAIATSIDALAVGITFAFFEVNLLLSISAIGTITFVLSILGTIIGNKFGGKLQNKAELTGGIILIIIGLKILLEHLGILML